MKEFLPFDMDRPMGQVRQLDIRMNEAGYLRLMTATPYMQNMSNDVLTEYEPAAPVAKKASFSKRLRNFKLIKWPLMRLYDWIFGLYYR